MSQVRGSLWRVRLDDDLRSVAARQYGLVSRRQARALGATTSGLRSRVRGPDWEQPTPRVLRLVGAPADVRQRVMLAVLDAGPGAVASHRTACAIWRLPGFSVARLELSRPRSRSRHVTTLADVHHPTVLGPAHVTERVGIPVTTLARTLFDVAGIVHPGRLARLVDTVAARSPSVLPTLRCLLDELGKPGRPGIAAMRALLAERGEGYVAVESGLEARFERILAAAGEAPLERQVDVGGHDWVGRVDFLDRRLRLVVEIDSALHHTSPLDRERDRQRDDALLRAGWLQVVRITDDEIWRDPAVAVGRVRDARRRALALVAGIDPVGSVLATRTSGRALA